MGDPDLSDDIWVKQTEAGRGIRVKDFWFCFMTGEVCSLARLSGTECRLWGEIDLTLNANSAAY